MPPHDRKQYFFKAKCDLFRYLIARPIYLVSAKAMSLFIIKEIISRFGIPGKIVVNGNPEFKKEVIILLD